MVEVKVKKLHPDAVIPRKQTKGAAAVDLHSVETTVIPAGEWLVVSIGLSLEIPQGYAGYFMSRSGLAAKHGVFITNGPGLIDRDYRGEIKAILTNGGNSGFRINKGDRIGQLMIVPVPEVTFIEVDELNETERGSGGFGSTGK